MNACLWMTLQQMKRYYGSEITGRSKQPNAIKWTDLSLSDFQLAVAGWATTWLIAAAIGIVPISWVVLQVVPSMFPLVGAVAVIGPLSGAFCLVELKIRSLLRRGSATGHEHINLKLLSISTLATFIMLPVLYFVVLSMKP